MKSGHPKRIHTSIKARSRHSYLGRHVDTPTDVLRRHLRELRKAKKNG
jgi:hypothetical protein